VLGIANSCARLSCRLGPPSALSVRRQLRSTWRGSIWAARAVRLTWKSLGPVPLERPRGSRKASRRSGPPIDCAAPCTSRISEPAATVPTSARRDIVGGAGESAIRSLATGVGRSGWVWTRSDRSGASARRALSARRMVANLIATWKVNAARNTQAP
jgi:hypothetical protein